MYGNVTHGHWPMATVIIFSAGRLVTHSTALLYCVARCEVATQNCQDQYLHNSSVDDCGDPADTAATCSIVLSNAGWWRGEVCAAAAALQHTATNVKVTLVTLHIHYLVSISTDIYWYLLIYTELTTRHTHRSLWSARTIDSLLRLNHSCRYAHARRETRYIWKISRY